MNLEELKAVNDPSTLGSDYLAAIWHDQQGDWERAHGVVQELPDADAAWVHAYLHRKEGDIGNSKYWYSRAGKPFPGDIPFDEEAAGLVAAFSA